MVAAIPGRYVLRHLPDHAVIFLRGLFKRSDRVVGGRRPLLHVSSLRVHYVHQRRYFPGKRSRPLAIGRQQALVAFVLFV